MATKLLTTLDATDGTIIVPTPTTNGHAANKEYVDNAIGGITPSEPFTANLGNGTDTTFSVTHNLNTIAVHTEVIEVSTKQVVLTDVAVTDANTVTISFGAYVPSTAQFRAVIQKH
jgi:hypothetical protein